MAKLFEKIKIKSIEFRNRIVVSPMCQYSSKDGFANEWHLVHLGTRAVGGAALVFTEATAVKPEGRISPDDLGIWKDEHITFLKKITSFIEAQGAIAGIQLAHAGRKASVTSPWMGNKPIRTDDGGWQPEGPSAEAFKEGDQVPRELSKTEITGVVDAFRDAAARAQQAGFKVIELHGAHGYLINEFLSPASNFRTDEYGGSFDKRIRFLLEVIAAVKTVWPEDYPLFLRISASDWSEKGWTADDSVELAKIVKDKGIDLMDCSSGGNVYKAPVRIEPMYQVQFAEKVKKESAMMTGAVGLITTAQQCQDILTQGKADMIVLARQLLRDPYFPLHAAKELGAEVKWPVQYERAKN
ncbi:MAG: NADPH dehydrogenase NamA [Chitinophagaceae bacterium]|nr:NADPH dehydrogenase NamA [Chitinophagaceae bacterium]